MAQGGYVQELGPYKDSEGRDRKRSKPYRARYRDSEKKERSQTFRTKGEAQKYLRSTLTDIDRGEHVDPAAGKITLRNWSGEWLASLSGLKAKTEAGYRELLRKLVLPGLGGLELREIKPAHLTRWLAAMEREGLSGARQRQALQVVNATMEMAVDNELILKNPVKARSVKSPRVNKRRQAILTAEQVDTLASSAENLNADAGTLIRFLAYSGCRWGEAVALRRKAITFEHRPDGSVLAHVRIQEAATEVPGRGLVFGTTKTHQSRTIVLPPFVSEDLLEHVEEGWEPIAPPEDLVFTAPMGGPLRGTNWRRKVWDIACEDSGMPIPDEPPHHLVIHDLRDTAASLMIDTGATIKQVQNALGHSSAAMTLDIYGGLYEDSLVELADRMEMYRPGGRKPPNAAQGAAQNGNVVALSQ